MSFIEIILSILSLIVAIMILLVIKSGNWPNK